VVARACVDVALCGVVWSPRALNRRAAVLPMTGRIEIKRTWERALIACMVALRCGCLVCFL
jgi:hypothetical protein